MPLRWNDLPFHDPFKSKFNEFQALRDKVSRIASGVRDQQDDQWRALAGL